MNKMQDSWIPILRSYAVLRPESFGGYLLNYLLPPEFNLDKIRFQIACMCNGDFTLKDIKDRLGGELNHSSDYIDHLVESTLGQFDDRMLLYWREEKLKSPRDLVSPSSLPGNEYHLSAPLAAIWEITRRCNLRCKHCFSDSGRPEDDELSTEEAKRVVDILEDRKVFYINFTGGEPLLRPDMLDILKYASAKKLSINLSTNGSLVTEEIAEALQSTNVFQVQISIDGTEDQHDRFRGVRGSFQQALQAIKLLKEAEIDIAISTTVNKSNISQISEIIDLAMDAGASVFKTTLFIPIGRGELNQGELVLQKEDVHKLALLMKEKKDEVKGRMQLEYDSCYSWLFEESRPTVPSWMKAVNLGCAAGRSNICIAANGDVLPCPFLRCLKMGNIRQDGFDEIWDCRALAALRMLRPEDLKGKCNHCQYLGAECYGGCRAAALAYNGELFAEDPFCWKNIVTGS